MSETATIVTDEDTLQRVVKDAVEDRLRTVLPQAFEDFTRQEWGDKDYVEEKYGWTARQLTYLRREGRIDYSKRGQRIMYHIPSLDEYLQKGRVRPSSGPLAEDCD